MTATYHRGFNVFDSAGIGLANEFYKAAALGADTVRVRVWWDEFEHVQGNYNFTKIDQLKSLVQSVRTVSGSNPNFKVLPVFSGIADYCTSKDPNHFYVTSEPDFTNYGVAAAQVLSRLGDCADFIELSNEPNQYRTVNPSSDEAPGPFYGVMAASVIYWIWRCHSVSKAALVGSMSIGSADRFSYLEQDGTTPYWGPWFTHVKAYLSSWLSYLLQSDQSTFNYLNAAYRVSFHSYPSLGSGSPRPSDPSNGGNTTADGATARVFSLVDDVAAAADGRPLWISETGVSENKVGTGDFAGTSGQTRFARILDYGVQARQPQLEGCLWFPLNDADPLANDSTSGFYKFGVASSINVNKVAGNVIKSLWA